MSALLNWIKETNPRAYKSVLARRRAVYAVKSLDVVIWRRRI